MALMRLPAVGNGTRPIYHRPAVRSARLPPATSYERGALAILSLVGAGTNLSRGIGTDAYPCPEALVRTKRHWCHSVFPSNQK